jgi:hypothetical protein
MPTPEIGGLIALHTIGEPANAPLIQPDLPFIVTNFDAATIERLQAFGKAR